MSDITPEKVAGLMAEWEAVYDESSNCWLGIESVEGNVARLLFEPAKITPFGEKPDAAKHFQAVVVPGEGPVVVASQEFLAAARALYRAHVIGAALPDEEYARAIYDRQEALNALTPEQLAVLAGDDENGGDDDV